MRFSTFRVSERHVAPIRFSATGMSFSDFPIFRNLSRPTTLFAAFAGSPLTRCGTPLLGSTPLQGFEPDANRQNARILKPISLAPKPRMLRIARGDYHLAHATEPDNPPELWFPSALTTARIRITRALRARHTPTLAFLRFRRFSPLEISRAYFISVTLLGFKAFRVLLLPRIGILFRVPFLSCRLCRTSFQKSSRLQRFDPPGNQFCRLVPLGTNQSLYPLGFLPLRSSPCCCEASFPDLSLSCAFAAETVHFRVFQQPGGVSFC